MTKTKTLPYNIADRLRTPEEMALYLDACIEESDGDAAFIAKALGDIARAQGMAQVAESAGLSRESLYKSLSGERVPDFSTVLKVMKSLGLIIVLGTALGVILEHTGATQVMASFILKKTGQQNAPMAMSKPFKILLNMVQVVSQYDIS